MDLCSRDLGERTVRKLTRADSNQLIKLIDLSKALKQICQSFDSSSFSNLKAASFHLLQLKAATPEVKSAEAHVESRKPHRSPSVLIFTLLKIQDKVLYFFEIFD